MSINEIYELINNSFSIQTPALLFPTISLIMLAHTNKFLAITTVIRKLHQDMSADKSSSSFFYPQIKSLQKRINLIVDAQKLGTISLIACLLSMTSIFINNYLSIFLFVIALFSMWISLVYALKELIISKDALNFILNDCENLNSQK